MSTTYQTLLVEERDDRVVVTPHRTAARNAIGGLRIREPHTVCDLLEREPKPRPPGRGRRAGARAGQGAYAWPRAARP